MASVQKANSTVCFAAELETSGLSVLAPVLKEKGLETFEDFAFCTPDPTGKDTAAFEAAATEFISHNSVKKEDGSHTRLLPKLRRLYQLSYIIATAAIKGSTDDGEQVMVVRLTPFDRASRTKTLRVRMTGFELRGPNHPSHKVTDRFSAILSTGLVVYVTWEQCTSRDEEVLQEPSVKALQITSDGLALQPMEKEATVQVDDQFSWDYALRRRALAADIAGLMVFEAMNLWHEALKAALLQSPPPGYRKISWQQLRAADQALFQAVALECESGTKAPTGSDKTAFESSFRNQMYSAGVRAFLAYLPSQTASNSSTTSQKEEIQRLKIRLANTEQALKKRKFEYEAVSDKGQSKGKGRKDKGRPTRRSNTSTSSSTPAEWGNLPTQHEGQRICYSYNLSACPLAKAGEKCFKGKHICPKCFGKHPLFECGRS